MRERNDRRNLEGLSIQELGNTDMLLCDVITKIMLLQLEYPDHQHIPLERMAPVSSVLMNAIILLNEARERLRNLSFERLT